jgi:hypothetical protein
MTSLGKLPVEKFFMSFLFAVYNLVNETNLAHNFFLTSFFSIIYNLYMFRVGRVAQSV